MKKIANWVVGFLLPIVVVKLIFSGGNSSTHSYNYNTTIKKENAYRDSCFYINIDTLISNLKEEKYYKSKEQIYIKEDSILMLLVSVPNKNTNEQIFNLYLQFIDKYKFRYIKNINAVVIANEKVRTASSIKEAKKFAILTYARPLSRYIDTLNKMEKTSNLK